MISFLQKEAKKAKRGRWVFASLAIFCAVLPALLGGSLDARYYMARRLVAATATAGYDTDAQAYIDAVNTARSGESAAALTTTAEEIIDDMVRLLKGGSAVNGQLTGLTAVNVWSNLQHFVMFRGSGNVGTGTTVKAIVGSDGTLTNGHPWDARGDNTDDYINFPTSESFGHSSTFIWGGLWSTQTNNNERIWILIPAGSTNDYNNEDGFCLLLTASSGANALALRALGANTISCSHAISAGASQWSIVLDSGTVTVEENGGTNTADTYSDTNAIDPAFIRYNGGQASGSLTGPTDSRPDYGLIVSSVLGATDRSNVHAILQAAYDALAAL